MSNQNSTCPCGSDIDFLFCCGRYISGEQHPPTAEALMRSRPTVLGLKDDTATKWIGLDIKSTCQGTELDDQGTVEFIARYKINGKAERLHETSRFKKEQGNWFYLDGVIQP